MSGDLKEGFIEEGKMKTGETGGKLAEMIKKAISDCEITTTEFNQIIRC